MLKDKSVYVILTGGLGNQLFQLAAALDVAGEQLVFIDWKVAKPRLNTMGLPEMASFQLPANVVLVDAKHANRFQEKSFSYLLTSGLSAKRYQRNHFFSRLNTILGSLVFSCRYRKIVRVSIGVGIGYSKIKKGILSPVMIGYFQSSTWTENPKVINALKEIRSLESSNELMELEAISRIERPLVLHVRLGDYKSEDAFGILDLRYYQGAIKLAESKYSFGTIWIFSDEIEIARKLFDFHIDHPVRFIDNLGNSTSTNFEAMRLGSGYIIANSSFSWWAARISRFKINIVVAPKPWFIGIHEETSLIPSDWKRLEGHDPSKSK
jgi:hypothetical protein